MAQQIPKLRSLRVTLLVKITDKKNQTLKLNKLKKTIGFETTLLLSASAYTECKATREEMKLALFLFAKKTCSFNLSSFCI